MRSIAFFGLCAAQLPLRCSPALRKSAQMCAALRRTQCANFTNGKPAVRGAPARTVRQFYEWRTRGVRARSAATRPLCAFLALLVFVGPAAAAAWTLPAGDMRLLTNGIFSRADRQFGGGRPDFSKAFVDTTFEYGFDDRLTLFLGQEYAQARWRSDGARMFSETIALEAGGRVRLHSGSSGVLSVQGTVFSASKLGLSTDSIDARRAELRLLYGRSFVFSDRFGFVDIEAATRWSGGWRPREHALDASIGVWLAPDWMAMLQSFNTVREGEAGYRMNKWELSLVGRLSQRWSLRLGMLQTASGSNAPAEQGTEISFWVNI